MPDLIVVNLSDGETFRCADLDEAKNKAAAHLGRNSAVSIEVTPEGGGFVITLEFDRSSSEWIAQS